MPCPNWLATERRASKTRALSTPPHSPSTTSVKVSKSQQTKYKRYTCIHPAEDSFRDLQNTASVLGRAPSHEHGPWAAVAGTPLSPRPGRMSSWQVEHATSPREQPGWHTMHLNLWVLTSTRGYLPCRSAAGHVIRTCGLCDHFRRVKSFFGQR